MKVHQARFIKPGHNQLTACVVSTEERAMASSKDRMSPISAYLCLLSPRVPPGTIMLMPASS